MRRRRETLGISQGRLGRHLGLTFSQIQKYEKGTNRIGAGRLFQIASFLSVQPSYFFEGLESDTDAGPDVAAAAGGPSRDEIRALIEAYSAIGDQATRVSVLALLRSMVPSGSGRRSNTG